MTVAEMVDVNADLGIVLGTEGGEKNTGRKTRDGAGDVVALNARLDYSVGEERDFTGVARCNSNILVGHQSVKQDGSNRNFQEQVIPTLIGDCSWRRREQLV